MNKLPDDYPEFESPSPSELTTMHHESFENPFKLNGRYENRNGPFTVLEFSGDKMRIRWDDGTEKLVSIEAQSRIFRNLKRDRSPIDSIPKPRNTPTRRKTTKHVPPPPLPDPEKASDLKLISSFEPVFEECCSNCQMQLPRHPVIMISNRSFCFRCAKNQYPGIVTETRRIQERERRRFAPLQKAYQEAKMTAESEISKYNSSRDSAAQTGFFKDSNRFLFAIAISLICGVIIPIVGLLAFFPAILILSPIWEREQAKKRSEFERTFSPPRPFSGKAPTPTFIPEPYVDLHPDCSNPTYLRIPYKRLEILKRDLYTCQICGQNFPDSDLEVHHIYSRIKGGTNSERNLITLCKKCHFKEDWFDHVHKFNQERIEQKNREEYRSQSM